MSRKNRCGLTLIEIMVALTVIIVGVLGAMMYRYSSALGARKADVQVGAGRVGLLILEGWKGAGGRANYDPEAEIGVENDLGPSDIIITKSGDGYEAQLAGGTGGYYYVESSFQDFSSPNDKATPTEMIRELRVDVTWELSAGTDIPSDLTGKVQTFKDYVIHTLPIP